MRTRLRLLLGTTFIALMLAVSALPGSAAPDKIFRLDITPTSAPAGSTTTFKAKFTNVTPGNSSFNSMTLTAPAGFTLSDPSISASTNPHPGATLVADGSVLTVTGLNAVRRNDFIEVSVSAAIPSIAGCADGSGSWSAEVWTGSNTAGNTFTMAATSTGLTTTLAANCTIQFTSGGSPSDGIVGTALTSANGSVEVEVLKNGGLDTNFSGSITVSIATGPSGAVLGGITTKNATNGVASFDDLTLDTIGTYTLKATSGSLEGTSSAFEIFGAGIDCGDEVDFSGGGSDVTLERTDEGPQSGCEEVPYSIVVRNNEVEFVKDEATVRAQGATFRLTITWGVAPGQYPSFGTTTFDIDFGGPIPAFTPEFCDRVGGVAQYPQNPKNGQYWPNGTAERPWCVDEVVVNGDSVTETFLGAGDPVIRRT